MIAEILMSVFGLTILGAILYSIKRYRKIAKEPSFEYTMVDGVENVTENKETK